MESKDILINDFICLLNKNAVDKNEYDTCLEQLCTGGFFGSNQYSIDDLHKTLKCKKTISFRCTYSPEFFDMCSKKLYINSILSPHYYINRNIYKGRGIISILDNSGDIYYVYINVESKSDCSTCDGDTEAKYHIVYSDDLADLIEFTHTTKEIKKTINSITNNWNNSDDDNDS
jgi:hypothetical protein